MTRERLEEIKSLTRAPTVASRVVRELIAALDTQQAGWKLVPIEPTVEMTSAGDAYHASENKGDYYKEAFSADGTYKAMLAAVPPKPQVTT